jgi:hypothetical protein
MEPSTPTEELKTPRSQVPGEDATVVLPAGQGGEPLQSPVSATGQHCASCGATLAPDQRYCVECGQRRGPTHPPFLDGVGAQQQSAPAPAPAKKGPRFSPNTALIAGIGTLMLAMATGVLIGRTSSPSSKNPSVQYVTAPPSGATGTTTGTPSTTEGSTGTSAGKGSKAGSGKSASNTAAKLLGGKAPSKPVVSVGSPGKGPGYQKGKFTGKFFGGSESKKQEEEEELGEEPSEKGKK